MRIIKIWKIMVFCLVFILMLSFCVALAEEWTCPKCRRINTGNFCPDCGTKKAVWICPTCGTENYSAYCENCGTAKPVETAELIGKWKFSALGTTMYLNIINDTEYVLDAADGGRMEGTYEIKGIYLTFTANGLAFLSGEYSISDM